MSYKKVEGTGLTSKRKVFQAPTSERVVLLQAIQDVSLVEEITIV